MLDAGTRLLSLVNQLAHRGRGVSIEFAEGYAGAMGYLDRIGFFDHLYPSVEVDPELPSFSASANARYRGKNPGVVELRPISLAHRDRSIPRQLADALEGAYMSRRDHSTLGHAAFTMFAELIDNIIEHSDTEVDGYVALQVYPRGGTALIAVSDSGRGILDTIKPSLTDQRLRNLSDPELIVRMFNEGYSRYGKERGCGLRQCAEHALKYNADLYLRLPTSSLHLVPARAGGYQQRNIAYCAKDLPLLWGTHIAFEFRLDNN